MTVSKELIQMSPRDVSIGIDSSLGDMDEIAKKIKKGDISFSDIQDKIAKSLAIMNIALFDQSSFEFKRVGDLRTLITSLEKTLFDEERLKDMNNYERLELYKIATRNLQSSLSFMQNMNASVSKSIESLGTAESIAKRASEEQRKEVEVESRDIKSVKSKIIAELLNRSKGNSENT